MSEILAVGETLSIPHFRIPNQPIPFSFNGNGLSIPHFRIPLSRVAMQLLHQHFQFLILGYAVMSEKVQKFASFQFLILGYT